MASITCKRGNGRYWYAVWKMDGVNKFKNTKIPVAGDKTRTRAQAEAAARIAANSMEALAKGRTTYTQAADALRTVAQNSGMGAEMPSVREYLTAFQGMAGAKTESNRRRAFSAFLEWLGSRADMRLDMLTKADMDKFFRYELTQVAVGTVGLFRTNLASAFNSAVDDDILMRSPMPLKLNLAKLAREVNPELGSDRVKRLPFSAEELRIIVNKFPVPWCDMSLVSVMTGGQRLGDVCCLRWDCIDFASDSLSFTTGKTGKEMNMPLHPSLRERLLNIRAGQDGQEEYVFPNMARRYQRGGGSVSSEFTALVKAWGFVKDDTEKTARKGKRKNVTQKSFHSFRHSAVSVLRSDKRITQDLSRAIVGHDSEEIERAYYTPDRADVMRGLDVIATSISPAAHESAPIQKPYPRTA